MPRYRIPQLLQLSAAWIKTRRQALPFLRPGRGKVKERGAR